jgi:hypothetical protein
MYDRITSGKTLGRHVQEQTGTKYAVNTLLLYATAKSLKTDGYLPTIRYADFLRFSYAIVLMWWNLTIFFSNCFSKWVVCYALSLPLLCTFGDTTQESGWAELLSKVSEFVFSSRSRNNAAVGFGSPCISHCQLANNVSLKLCVMHNDDGTHANRWLGLARIAACGNRVCSPRCSKLVLGVENGFNTFGNHCLDFDRPDLRLPAYISV